MITLKEALNMKRGKNMHASCEYRKRTASKVLRKQGCVLERRMREGS